MYNKGKACLNDLCTVTNINAKKPMKIIITGATGYIGRRVVLAALRVGHDCVSASRCPHQQAPWIHFDLTTASSFVFPPGTGAVIHLAADTSPGLEKNSEIEIKAAQHLIKAAQKIKAKFIFVSSQTARPDAPTKYGQTKWRIEQEVLAVGGWVVRPGMVYGGSERGLFGTLVGVTRRLPLLPYFFPIPKVQPIHVDDLAIGLLRLAECEDIPPGVLCLASNEPVSFSLFLSAIASSRLHRHRWFIPVPVLLIKAVLAIMGNKLSSGLGIHRLLSLFELPVMETTGDLQRLGLSLRPVQSGMHRAGDDRRRLLISEGRSLLTYILKEQPGFNLLCRYVRAVEMVRDGFSLKLPGWVIKFPFMIALIDRRTLALSHPGVELIWRLDAATALAEATIQGSRRFLGLGQRSGLLSSLSNIGYAIIAEVFCRIFGLICRPLLWFSMDVEKGQG